jgi:hypothetical protein
MKTNKKRHLNYYSGVFQFNRNSEVRFLDAPPGEILGTQVNPDCLSLPTR